MSQVDLTARSWDSPEQRAAALRWYAEKHETTVLTDVPITGSNRGDWGPGCPRHVASVALPTGAPGVVRAFDEDTFTASLSDKKPLRPILPWGGAGRYALGWLLAYKAYLERSWQPQAPVRPLALVAPGEDHPNTETAFEAFDLDIVAVDGSRDPSGTAVVPPRTIPGRTPSPEARTCGSTTSGTSGSGRGGGWPRCRSEREPPGAWTRS